MEDSFLSQTFSLENNSQPQIRVVVHAFSFIDSEICFIYVEWVIMSIVTLLFGSNASSLQANRFLSSLDDIRGKHRGYSLLNCIEIDTLSECSSQTLLLALSVIGWHYNASLCIKLGSAHDISKLCWSQWLVGKSNCNGRDQMLNLRLMSRISFPSLSISWIRSF